MHILPPQHHKGKASKNALRSLLASIWARPYSLPLPFSHLFSRLRQLLSEALIVSLNEGLTRRETVGFDVILVSPWIGSPRVFNVSFPFVTATSIPLLPLIRDRVFHAIAGRIK